MVRVESDKSSNDNKTGSRVARSVDKSQQSSEKQEWANDKLELETARRLRGIQFIDPEGKECEENYWECKKKVGSAYGSGQAVQKK